MCVCVCGGGVREDVLFDKCGWLNWTKKDLFWEMYPMNHYCIQFEYLVIWDDSSKVDMQTLYSHVHYD